MPGNSPDWLGFSRVWIFPSDSIILALVPHIPSFDDLLMTFISIIPSRIVHSFNHQFIFEFHQLPRSVIQCGFHVKIFSFAFVVLISITNHNSAAFISYPQTHSCQQRDWGDRGLSFTWTGNHVEVFYTKQCSQTFLKRIHQTIEVSSTWTIGRGKNGRRTQRSDVT